MLWLGTARGSPFHRDGSTMRRVSLPSITSLPVLLPKTLSPGVKYEVGGTSSKNINTPPGDKLPRVYLPRRDARQQATQSTPAPAPALAQPLSSAAVMQQPISGGMSSALARFPKDPGERAQWLRVFFARFVTLQKSGGGGGFSPVD